MLDQTVPFQCWTRVLDSTHTSSGAPAQIALPHANEAVHSTCEARCPRTTTRLPGFTDEGVVGRVRPYTADVAVADNAAVLPGDAIEARDQRAAAHDPHAVGSGAPDRVEVASCAADTPSSPQPKSAYNRMPNAV